MNFTAMFCQHADHLYNFIIAFGTRCVCNMMSCHAIRRTPHRASVSQRFDWNPQFNHFIVTRRSNFALQHKRCIVHHTDIQPKMITNALVGAVMYGINYQQIAKCMYYALFTAECRNSMLLHTHTLKYVRLMCIVPCCVYTLPHPAPRLYYCYSTVCAVQQTAEKSCFHLMGQQMSSAFAICYGLSPVFRSVRKGIQNMKQSRYYIMLSLFNYKWYSAK